MLKIGFKRKSGKIQNLIFMCYDKNGVENYVQKKEKFRFLHFISESPKLETKTLIKLQLSLISDSFNFRPIVQL